MESRIESAMKRGRGYWFVDGFTELFAGILFLLLGGITMLCGIMTQNPFLSLAGGAAMVKIFGLVLAALGLWWLKDRFTYPRTGFVRGKRVQVAQMLAFLRNAVLIAVLPALGLTAAIFFLPPLRGAVFSMPVWLPPVLSAFWAVLCILLGTWTSLRRFRLIGAVVLFAGIAAGAWQLALGLPSIPADALQANILGPLPEVFRALLQESFSRLIAGLGLLTLLSGITFTVSGLVTFLRYRKDNPVPYQEEL